MGSRAGAARTRCWELRRAGKDPLTASDFAESQRPAPNRAKDFLGAAMSLAIVGAIFLFVTDSVASHCTPAQKPQAGPGACAGLPAIASHIHGIATLFVMACAALAAIAFIWYMFWGYKTNGHVEEGRGG
ncbi:MAG TPA: hypothetical protein VIX86_10440 [Streptosporangiaceae bacterium]